MWHQCVFIISFIVLLSIATSAPAQERHEGEFIIRFKAHVEEAQMISTLNEFDLVIKKQLIPNKQIYLCKTKGEVINFEELLAMLNTHPDVKYAEPNWKVRALEGDQ